MKIFTILKNKIFYITILVYSLFHSKIVFASSNNEAATKATDELKKLLSNDNGTGLMDIVQKAGFVILVFGLGQMFMAFKDDNADQKAKGAMVLLGGAFCIIIKIVLEGLGVL